LLIFQWGFVLLEVGGIEVDGLSADGSEVVVFELEGFVMEGVDWTDWTFGALY
jgi:hypothetical protein